MGKSNSFQKNRLIVQRLLFLVLTFMLTVNSLAVNNNEDEYEDYDETDINSIYIFPEYDSKAVDINGKKISLSLFKGSWVLMYFWSSNSPWSIERLESLKQYANLFGQKLVIICIGGYDTEAEWKHSIKANGLPMSWIHLHCKENSKLYWNHNVSGFPTLILVSPDGKRVSHSIGDEDNEFNRYADILKQFIDP